MYTELRELDLYPVDRRTTKCKPAKVHKVAKTPNVTLPVPAVEGEAKVLLRLVMKILRSDSYLISLALRLHMRGQAINPTGSKVLRELFNRALWWSEIR
jgi:hypothetical protein